MLTGKYIRGEVTESLENELCSFSKLFVASPTSQLILQPFPRCTYATAHSPALPLLHLRHTHSPTLLSLLLRHRLFTCVTCRAHYPSFPSLHLRHSSFSNPSVALPKSQLFLQPIRCFIYVTLILQPFFRFSYVQWRCLVKP